MRKHFITMVVVLVMIVLSGCGSNVVDQVKNAVNEQDEHVQMVKNGYLKDYPSKTVGELFENFFGNPTWQYFAADSGEQVVEFTGDMMYSDTQVKAKLQIILDGDAFEFGALAFNEVPQNELIKAAVLNAILEENDIVETSDVSNGDVVEATEDDYSFNLEGQSMFEIATNGYVPELQFGIGDSIDTVINLYGSPIEAGLYEGSYFLLYDDFTVFNDNIESEYSGYVSQISFFTGKMFDINIGDSIESVYDLFGEPVTQYMDEEIGYTYEYQFGDYILDIIAYDFNSPIKRLYYY